MQIPNQLDSFRKDYNEAMKALEEKYNVSISAGRMTYDEDSFRFKSIVNSKSSTSAQVIPQVVSPKTSNEVIVVGDMVTVDHPKTRDLQFRVIKINRVKMKLENEVGQRFNAPHSMINKI